MKAEISWRAWKVLSPVVPGSTDSLSGAMRTGNTSLFGHFGDAARPISASTE